MIKNYSLVRISYKCGVCVCGVCVLETNRKLVGGELRVDPSDRGLPRGPPLVSGPKLKAV